MSRNQKKNDDKERDDILKKMLKTPPTKNKPLKEKESAKDPDNGHSADA